MNLDRQQVPNHVGLAASVKRLGFFCSKSRSHRRKWVEAWQELTQNPVKGSFCSVENRPWRVVLILVVHSNFPWCSYNSEYTGPIPDNQMRTSGGKARLLVSLWTFYCASKFEDHGHREIREAEPLSRRPPKHWKWEMAVAWPRGWVFRFTGHSNHQSPAPALQKLRLSWPRELWFLEAPMVSLKQVGLESNFRKIPKR